MSGQLELRLEVIPGVLKASWIPLAGKAVVPQTISNSGDAPAILQGTKAGQPLSLKVPVWPATRRQEVLRHLALSPNEMYALLQGHMSGLDELELLPTDIELAHASFDQAGEGNKEEALKQVKKRLAEEPLLALALRGLSKAELLDGIFSLWAEEENEAAEEEGTAQTSGLAAELARLERKGPAVSSGEWLAEAAAEGSLHQPGPLFHEIEARPFPSLSVVAVATEDWAALLPKTTRAQEGLTLIMQRVAQAAAGRAGHSHKR